MDLMAAAKNNKQNVRSWNSVPAVNSLNSIFQGEKITMQTNIKCTGKCLWKLWLFYLIHEDYVGLNNHSKQIN